MVLCHWRVLALAAAGAASFGSSLSAGEVLHRVEEKGVMVMSTDPEYPPQSFLNADGQFEGFDVEVGRAIAERLGVDIQFVTPPTSMPSTISGSATARAWMR
jgi:polar amino acid transport system substrate-binding protein